MRKFTVGRTRHGNPGRPARTGSVERLRRRPGRRPSLVGRAQRKGTRTSRRGANRRRRGGSELRVAVPVGHARSPGLPGVVFAHLVVLPVGRPHIPGCRAVAASVLEAVVALTSLHTYRIIFGCEPRAIPRQSEVAAARLRRRPVLPGSRGSARAARAGRRREPPRGSRRPGGGRRRCGCAARGSRSPTRRPGDRD